MFSLTVRSGFQLLLWMLIISIISCHSSQKQSLKIAIASNLTEPMNEIADLYEKEYDLSIDLIIGSSGKLTAQITHGAPYDIFLSADMKYLDALKEEGKLKSDPLNFVKGRLILWASDTTVSLSFQYLSEEMVKKIAMPNPNTAPFGKAALQALQKLDLWNEIENKMVYGESVTQTNQFLITEAVQAGITSLSVVHSPRFNNPGQWINLAPELHDPVIHGIGIISSTEKNEECNRFINFLMSEKSKEILSHFGYQFIL